MISQLPRRSLCLRAVMLSLLLAPAAALLAQDFGENFDAVTAPILPSGWTATNAEPGWITTNVNPSSPPYVAFVNDAAYVTDKHLDSPSFTLPAGGAQLIFQHTFDTDPNFDGGVLEISIAGGPFVDIVTAGGNFLTGGYTGPIDSATGNPLGGRLAWNGASGAYILTTVNLPPSAANQSIQLRWRMGTDTSNQGAFAGWRVDNVSIPAAGFGQNFDTVTPPALPPGWTAGNVGDWGTDTINPDTAPNDAHADEVPYADDRQLISPSITIPAAGTATLTFRNSYDMETDLSGNALDFGVLEISIAGGAFQDIIAAGGTFLAFGYDHNNNTVWSFSSDGYVTTIATLPPSANGKSVRLRWRFVTDATENGQFNDGWRIDTITLVSCPPTAVASAADTTICSNSSTTLSGSGGDTCLWSPVTWLSDPLSCTPTVTPNGGIGTVTYTLTVTKANCPPGSNTDTATATVTSQALPIAAATASRTSICPGGLTTLNGSGGNSCVWTPSTGLSNANSCSPTARPTVSTTYSLTVTNTCGSSTNNATVNITVTAQPQGPEVVAPATVTVGDTGLLASIVNPNFASTYVWDFLPASAATITSQGTSSIFFTVNTVGPLTLSVTENNGSCLSDPTTISIDVNPICLDPQPPPSALIQPTGNPNGPVTGIDFLDFSWTEPTAPPLFYLFALNGGPTQTTEATSVLDQPPTGSNDAITLSVRSACSDEVFSDATEFTVSPTPPGADFSIPESVGVGTTVTFTDTSEPDATSWLWIFGDGGLARTQSATHIYEAEGIYTVWLVASNGAGVSAVSHQVNVVPAGALVAHGRTRRRDFEATKDPVRRRLSEVHITGTGRTWLRIASHEETREAIVFLRFLDQDGKLQATRRLAVNPGDEAAYDLGAYGLHGVYTVELVSFRRVESTLVEPARTRTVKERREEP